MSDCVFCRIAAGDIPAPLLHSDEHCLAIADREPKAPLHLLIIPRRHLAGPAALAAEGPLGGHLLAVAARLARERGAEAGGYRLVLNQGADGGQTVFHLHLHLLAGRPLGAMG